MTRSHGFSVKCSAFIPEGQQTPLPMVAPVSIQMAQYLAKYFTAGLPVDFPAFKYHDKGSMATIEKKQSGS